LQAAEDVSKNDSERRTPSDHTRAAFVHELRTPLNAILAWAQMLTPDLDDAEVRHGLDVIVRSARRQARLLDDLASGATTLVEELADRTAEPVPDLKGVSILVVDDDEASREGTARILTGAGAVVDPLSSAADTLACLRRHHADVVVSDLTMPSMDGYDLVTAMRADPSTRVRQTPAIALSALTSSRARQRAYRAGFQLQLVKPVEAAELCLAVASVICRAGMPRAEDPQRGRRRP
jgi:CheY-like chemotaxis protein